MRRCLLVVGMHRSGTSALSRTLNLLGASMKYQLQEPESDNEKGFWEPSEVVATHEQLFADIGFRHDTSLGLTNAVQYSEAFEVARARLSRFVENVFSADDTIVLIKDPRVCRLIPLWQDVLESAGFEVDIIIPIRNPMEVALSLQARNRYHINKGLLMWLRHVLEAERNSRSCRRSIVTYDQLMTDWRALAYQISRDLKLQWPREIEEVAGEIDAFLDPAMRHHCVDTDKPNTNLAWVADTWEAMQALVHQSQHRLPVLDRAFEELGRAEIAFMPLISLDAELPVADILQLRSELDAHQQGLEESHGREQKLHADLNTARQLVEEHSAEIANLHTQLHLRQIALDESLLANQSMRVEWDAARTQAAGLLALHKAERERQEEVLRNCQAMSEQLLEQVADLARHLLAIRKEWNDGKVQVDQIGARTDSLAEQVRHMKRRLIAADKSFGATRPKRGRPLGQD